MPRVELIESLGDIGHLTILLDKRKGLITVAQQGKKAVHFDAGLCDYVCREILNVLNGIAPDSLARSDGETYVWAERGNLCIQTRGRHDGTLIETEDALALLRLLTVGRMVLDGRP